MTVKILILALFLQCISLILSQSPTVDDSQRFTLLEDGRPNFCRDRDCPPFVVLNSYPNQFQVRKYARSRWITSNIKGEKLEKSKKDLFKRLFEYIAGRNQDYVMFDMTTPVLYKLLKAPSRGYLSNYNMSFYIHDKRPVLPAPGDPTVHIMEIPEFTVYTRSFPGFVSDKMTWVKQQKLLKKYLAEKGFNYVDDQFYAVTYDSPYELSNRHNEVWVMP